MIRNFMMRTPVVASQVAVLAILLAATACDPNKVLDVDDIDVVTPGQLNSKANLPALRNGVLSTFQLAFSGGADLATGGHEGQINMSGLLSAFSNSSASRPDMLI